MEISIVGSMCVVLLLIIASSTLGAKIQLYKDADYSDLLLEINPTDACYTVPSNKKVQVKSIITDVCFIAYEQPNCKATMTTKIMPGKKVTTSYNVGRAGIIESLHICNDQEGGPKLNIDITTHIRNIRPPGITNILESYNDVCTCVNVPSYVNDMTKWSIDNPANGLFAYFESDCTEVNSKALYIVAGHWINSRDMHAHSRQYSGTTKKIQSLGPASNSTYFQLSCSASVSSNDKIMKLELFEAMNNSRMQIDADLIDNSTNSTTDADDDLMHFFAETNFQGFHFGSRSTTRCNNFLMPVQRKFVNGVGAIKTKTCVILYSEHNCMGRSVKIEAPGIANLTNMWESTLSGESTLSLLYTNHPNWKWETKSYHVCNREEGGSSLKVDIISSDQNVAPLDGPVILETYHNLCTCRNVPGYVYQLDNWAINNHGNDMVAYFHPNCLSSPFSPLWIPAGISSYSLGLGLFKQVDQTTGIIHKIQSFGPDPNSEYFLNHCNTNCTTISTFGNGTTAGITTGDICEFDDKNECTQTALFIVERMQSQEAKLEVLINNFQKLLNQVNELEPFHQQAELNLENVRHEFDDKLEKQRDEIQELTDKLNSHLNH